MKPLKYVYLVWCNPEPKLVYGVYLSKKAALKYAQMLVKHREDRAKKNSWPFGFYHYVEEEKRKESDLERREKVIFSCCMKIEDGATSMSENGCFVQVIRRSISK